MSRANKILIGVLLIGYLLLFGRFRKAPDDEAPPLPAAGEGIGAVVGRDRVRRGEHDDAVVHSIPSRSRQPLLAA